LDLHKHEKEGFQRLERILNSPSLYDEFLRYLGGARRRAPAKSSAALQKQGIKTDARGEYLRLCADLLNSRAELERAASALGVLCRPERKAG
jgi:tryptophan 2,3-dioxygenase